MLKVKPILPHEINTLNNKIREGCEKLGYHGFVTSHNRENCTTSRLLPARLPVRRQAEHAHHLHPGGDQRPARASTPIARCRRMRRRGGRVRARRGRGRRRARPRRSTASRRGRSSWCSAPARSTRRRFCCSSGIANASGQVGRNLHLHPSVLLSGLYDEDIYGYRGIPQSYYVDEFIDLEKNPDSGYILMPVYGFPVMTGDAAAGLRPRALGDDAQLPSHGRHAGADARPVGRRVRRRPPRQAGRSPTT